MSKQKKSKTPVDAATACSPSSDTPETDKIESQTPTFLAGMYAWDHARKLERERNQWRNEHDRVVREYQHRLMVIGTSVIEATSYPENAEVSHGDRERQPDTHQPHNQP